MFSSVPAEVEVDHEKSVLDAVKGGQTDRFGELVTAYQNRLYAAMFAMLGDRQDAEDVTQEAFTRAFLKLEAFQAKSSFFTWLHRIAFNLAIDSRRRERRARNIGLVSMDIASETLESSDPSPPKQSELSETQRKVYDALAKIDPERRSVITLRDIQGMDYAEIADVLAIPIGTVRSRLHRARIEMKALLADYLQAGSLAQREVEKGGSLK